MSILSELDLDEDSLGDTPTDPYYIIERSCDQLRQAISIGQSLESHMDGSLDATAQVFARHALQAINTEVQSTGLESNQDFVTLSLEGIGATVSRLIAAIVRAIMNFFKRVKQFVSSLFSRNEDVTQMLHMVSRRAKERSGWTPKHERTKIGLSGVALSTERRTLENSSHLMLSLQTVTELLKTVCVKNRVEVKFLGANLAKAIGSWKNYGTRPEAWLEQVNKLMAQHRPREVLNSFGRARDFIDPRFEAGTAFRSEPLPNFRALIAVDNSERYAKAGNALQASHYLQGNRLQLANMASERPSPDSEMATLSILEIQQAAAMVDNIVKLINDATSALNSETAAVQAALTRAIGSIQHANHGENQYLERGIAYSGTWLLLMSQSQTDILGYASSVARSSTLLLANHLRQY